MSVPPIGALGAPADIQATTGLSTTETHRKHGTNPLQGSFAIVASNALGAIGQAHIAASDTVQTASNAVQTALNNLKPGI